MGDLLKSLVSSNTDVGKKMSVINRRKYCAINCLAKLAIALVFMVPLYVHAAENDDLPEFDDSEFFDEEFADDAALLEEEALELDEVTIWDPLEPVNRGVFWFNDKAYRYVLKPVARGFRVVPKPVRKSGSNFFSNLFTPIRAINSLLQLKLKKTGTELARFGINTTIGIGGLFDPADKYFKLKKHNEDMGQTLGSYGLGHGLYIVIPFLGPSSARDGVGLIGDLAIDPVNRAFAAEDVALGRAVNLVNELSLDNDTYESLTDDSLDPYATIRDAYLQSRKKSVEE